MINLQFSLNVVYSCTIVVSRNSIHYKYSSYELTTWTIIVIVMIKAFHNMNTEDCICVFLSECVKGIGEKGSPMYSQELVDERKRCLLWPFIEQTMCFCSFYLIKL